MGTETASRMAPGRAGSAAVAGAAAGALGAVAMILYVAAAAAWDGGDALGPLRSAGATFRAAEPLSGAGAIAWGILLHVLAGAALGVVFAWIVPADFPAGGAMALGAGYGVLALALALSFVLPWAAPALVREMPRLGGSWVIAACVYGAAVGLAPALGRRGRAQRPRAPTVLRPRTAP